MTELSGKQDEMSADRKLDRRRFLYVGGAAAALGTAGLLVGGRVLAGPDAKSAAGSAVKYGMVIDLDRCFGCRACMEACKVENNTASAVFWMYTFRLETGEYPDTRLWFMPRPCMHCDNAPCVKVCPVGARYKRADGLVLTDFNSCIGCRYCQIACPYSVNYFNWKKPSERQYYAWQQGEGDNVNGKGRLRDYIGDAVPPYQNPDHQKLYGQEQRLVAGGGHYTGTIEKCTFCVHRLEKGLPPACVANCPANALHFGNLNDPRSDVSQLLRKKTPHRLLEELGTEPSVYYVGEMPSLEMVKQIQTVSAKMTPAVR